jgi:Protein of unknown function, DUF488
MILSNLTRNALYIIGHSNHDLGDFLAILVHHGVETLCDVRSWPGSCRFPQFNREPLEAAAALAKIEYQFLGESLGGRPDDPRVYRPMVWSITSRVESLRISRRASIAFWNSRATTWT